jgi:hypothetical protein
MIPQNGIFGLLRIWTRRQLTSLKAGLEPGPSERPCSGRGSLRIPLVCCKREHIAFSCAHPSSISGRTGMWPQLHVTLLCLRYSDQGTQESSPRSPEYLTRPGWEEQLFLFREMWSATPGTLATWGGGGRALAFLEPLLPALEFPIQRGFNKFHQPLLSWLDL